jgi:hypothetical protein
MDLQILITLALGMPENREFHALDFIARDAGDSPLPGQQTFRRVDGVFVA